MFIVRFFRALSKSMLNGCFAFLFMGSNYSVLVLGLFWIVFVVSSDLVSFRCFFFTFGHYFCRTKVIAEWRNCVGYYGNCGAQINVVGFIYSVRNICEQCSHYIPDWTHWCVESWKRNLIFLFENFLKFLGETMSSITQCFGAILWISKIFSWILDS